LDKIDGAYKSYFGDKCFIEVKDQTINRRVCYIKEKVRIND